MFCKAIEHLAAWLGSQSPTTRALEVILDVVFMPNSTWATPPTNRPHAWDIIFDIVRSRSTIEPWRKLCLLLPKEESWEICFGMTKRYLAMPVKYVAHIDSDDDFIQC